MLAALQSGGHIRYVQTSHSTAVRGGQHQELVELVVDCGGGAVEARIHVKLHFEEAYDDVFVNVLLLLPFVKQILVEIVASKV